MGLLVPFLHGLFFFFLPSSPLLSSKISRCSYSCPRNASAGTIEATVLGPDQLARRMQDTVHVHYVYSNSAVVVGSAGWRKRWTRLTFKGRKVSKVCRSPPLRPLLVISCRSCCLVHACYGET
ncbi:hypothetical protein F5B21DRAFT_351201 [Xylaria acuta]|nr:hypothetical protein F5B21DRAFT_351201 [Xylaria acuta]